MRRFERNLLEELQLSDLQGQWKIIALEGDGVRRLKPRFFTGQAISPHIQFDVSDRPGLAPVDASKGSRGHLNPSIGLAPKYIFAAIRRALPTASATPSGRFGA